jgi:hypothetical protein
MVVSYAVVRTEPPQVYLADDIETLQWVLALKVVARTHAGTLPGGLAESIRSALREERWADAVVDWIGATDTPVDVYPSIEVYEARHVAMGPAELQFTALFQDES